MEAHYGGMVPIGNEHETVNLELREFDGICNLTGHRSGRWSSTSWL